MQFIIAPAEIPDFFAALAKMSVNPTLSARLDALTSGQLLISKRMDQIMSALDDLKAADAKLGTSVAAAVSTLNADTTQLADLAAQVAAGVGDPATVSAMAADISAKADALNAAINPPPAAPAPTPAAGTSSVPGTA